MLTSLAVEVPQLHGLTPASTSIVHHSRIIVHHGFLQPCSYGPSMMRPIENSLTSYRKGTCGEPHKAFPCSQSTDMVVTSSEELLSSKVQLTNLHQAASHSKVRLSKRTYV